MRDELLAEWSELGYYSIWPFFLCLALLLLLAGTPLFRAADTPPIAVKNRVVSLDGLRGFLALAVVFNHLAVYRPFLQTGLWAVPTKRFYALLGPVGVSLFFMITGYLFWGRMVRDSGQINWRGLFLGRLFRIGPLCLFAAIALLLVVFGHTGPHLLVSGTVLLKQVGRWLSLGLLVGKEVNGWEKAPTVLAGVTWTLQWEWFFYLSLPLFAILAAKKRWHIPFLVGLLIVSALARILRSSRWSSLAIFPDCDLFLAGMLSASLGRQLRAPALPNWASSCLVAVCFVAAMWQPEAYSLQQLVALGAAFYLVSSGCTLFGLLVSRPARRLGDISYGIYLLQGLVMFFLFHPAKLRTYTLSSPAHHWIMGLVCCVLLMFLATAAHVWIERPGIALGRRVSKRWASGRSPAGGKDAHGSAALVK